MIGWGPSEFRDATIRDLAEAMNGWREKHNLPPLSDSGSGISRDRLEQLKQQYG